MKSYLSHWECKNQMKKYNFFRNFDTQEVSVLVHSDGLQHTYRGILYFGTGNPLTLMVGTEEIYMDCIKNINGQNVPQ